MFHRMVLGREWMGNTGKVRGISRRICPSSICASGRFQPLEEKETKRYGEILVKAPPRFWLRRKKRYQISSMKIQRCKSKDLRMSGDRGIQFSLKGRKWQVIGQPLRKTACRFGRGYRANIGE